MKYFFFIFSFLFMSQHAISQKLSRYKMHIVSWDKSRLTGRLESINDTSISIKIKRGRYRGKVFTYSAKETKNLKIWKPGYHFPFTMLGSTGLTILAASATDDGLAKAIAIVYGIPLGAAIGLFTGDQISTKVNKRRMHNASFSDIKSKIERTL